MMDHSDTEILFAPRFRTAEVYIELLYLIAKACGLQHENAKKL